VTALDGFVTAAVEAADLSSMHLVITSDHGNVEDMSVKSHTHHPVPTLVWGPRAAAIAARLRRLEDFAAVILEETGAGG
jgi:bisphosphoglycerate-independent phosphoglycerate mutase (AlkP superfamily)